MPFPVIPVVVASGITALVTYVGVRMAMDEKCEHLHDDTGDADKTAREDEDARETFYKARRLLEVRREKTQGKLESLGRQKAVTCESVLIPFEETFSRIRNVDLGDTGLPPVPAKVVRGIAPESAQIRRTTAHMAEVVAGGVDALGPDALAALAACGSAGVCVPASGGPHAATATSAAGVPPSSSTRPAVSGFFATGRSASASADPSAAAPSDADAPASASDGPAATAPSDADAPATASGSPPSAAPSGLAAGNATLAWLRGGALPSGDGSTVILGGVAAAPVLLVSGFMLPSQAGVSRGTSWVLQNNNLPTSVARAARSRYKRGSSISASPGVQSPGATPSRSSKSTTADDMGAARTCPRSLIETPSSESERKFARSMRVQVLPDFG